MLETLKWTATVLLIIGFGGVSAGFYNFIFLQLTGGIFWLMASIWMKDKPLIITNLVMTLVGIAGMAYKVM